MSNRTIVSTDVLKYRGFIKTARARKHIYKNTRLCIKETEAGRSTLN
jgi:hypothetical protein